MKTFVYIAAPYTRPDPIINTQLAVSVADELLARGYVPIVPHLTMLWHLISPRPIEEWYAYDIDVMSRCDAVLRLPGESVGATAEVDAANLLGIPVFFTIDELASAFPQ